jgi:hypothetical protein
MVHYMLAMFTSQDKNYLATETTTIQAHVGIKVLEMTPVMTMVQGKVCTTDTKHHQGARYRAHSRHQWLPWHKVNNST